MTTGATHACKRKTCADLPCQQWSDVVRLSCKAESGYPHVEPRRPFFLLRSTCVGDWRWRCMMVWASVLSSARTRASRAQSTSFSRMLTKLNVLKAGFSFGLLAPEVHSRLPTSSRSSFVGLLSRFPCLNGLTKDGMSPVTMSSSSCWEEATLLSTSLEAGQS